MSYTDVTLQPQTHMDEEFLQWQRMRSGGPYSEQLYKTSGEFMPRYSQRSIATSSGVLPEQHNSQPSLPNPLSQSEDRTPINVRGDNWSVEEDEKLCNAWVRVSTDPIRGDNQKKTTFWQRVFDEFVKEHGENTPVTRNQKTCDQRFQHIRAECNKWSAAKKKIYAHPKSGENALDAQRAIRDYYKGQNNGKLFKLEHCWEILQQCAKFNEPHGTAKTSASAPFLLDPVSSQCDRPLNDVVNEDSPTPTIGKKPSGRKASKEKARGKRQRSEDAQSSIGDRIVKSIDEMNASSAAEIAKIRAQNAEDKQMEMRLKNIKMNKERIQSISAMIALERQLMEYDGHIFSKQPGLIGSSNDAKRRIAARHARVEQLYAQAQAFLAYNIEEPPETQTARNLNQSFNDEADNPEEEGRERQF